MTSSSFSSSSVAILATTALTMLLSPSSSPLLLPTSMSANAFSHPPPNRAHAATAAIDTAYTRLLRPTSSSTSSTRRWASPESDENNDSSPPSSEAERIKEKARMLRLEAERLQLALGLKKIDALEGEIEKARSRGENDEAAAASESKSSGTKTAEWKRRTEELVRASLGKDEAEEMLSGLMGTNTAPASTSTSTASPSDSDWEELRLSKEELETAASYVGSLPIPARDALARAAGYAQGFDSVDDVEAMILALYNKRDSLSPTDLRRLYFESFAKSIAAAEGTSAETSSSEKATADGEQSGRDRLRSKLEETFDKMDENKTLTMELFPSTVKDAGDDDALAVPTRYDADVVFNLLDRTTFMATERPLPVSGGYMIRGENKRKTPAELLEVLDEKLSKESPDWSEKFQMSYVDVPVDADRSATDLSEPVILLTANKFPSTAPAALSVASTVASLGLSIVYCIDSFGGNDIVLKRLKDAADAVSGAGDAAVGNADALYDLTWFGELFFPIVATLGAAQFAHEMGHLTVAWANGIKLTPPTILPSQALPFLSFQNRLKTSPKDYTALFDLGFAGPVAGLTVSFLALLYGLQLTTTVDPETARLLPSLPVGLLTQSSLGATVIDQVLGGGDGILLAQEPDTLIPLHPIALGGFLSLIVNALDLIPLGSTDGGRMSQAVFGRIFHLAFSSAIFFALLISTFAADERGILLGFLFVTSFTQRDMEVLCRNEVEKADLPRAVAAFVVWFVVVLILVPL